MFERMAPDAATQTSRALQLGLAAVIGLAVVGYLVGLRQGTPIQELRPPVLDPDQRTDQSIPAASYTEFDRRERGPNRDWTNRLDLLKQPPIDLMADYSETPIRVRDPEKMAMFLAQRSARRAYEGAPPTVPHPIDQLGTASCQACHDSGMYIGKQVWAPPMSHPLYPNCTQCHAESHSTEFDRALVVHNHFDGLGSWGPGARAWAGAPPTIPHPTFMRENCMSCHGPLGSDPIRTSHPWRISCTQCHAPSAELDQVVSGPGAGHSFLQLSRQLGLLDSSSGD